MAHGAHWASCNLCSFEDRVTGKKMKQTTDLSAAPQAKGGTATSCTAGAQFCRGYCPFGSLVQPRSLNLKYSPFLRLLELLVVRSCFNRQEGGYSGNCAITSETTESCDTYKVYNLKFWYSSWPFICLALAMGRRCCACYYSEGFY